VTSTDTTAPAAVTCHYVITVQTAYGEQGTFDATVDVPAGMSRVDAFRQIRALAAQQMGTEEITVLFFDLQPNTL
jgi:hypothetical protein